MVENEILILSISILAGTIRIATPLLMAAIGEMFAQRSGVANLGIEGIMTIGALSGFIGAYETGNIWFGVLLGLVIGGLGAALMAVLSVGLKIGQAISGLSIWFLFAGMAVFINKVRYGPIPLPHIEGVSPISIPLLSQIPILGPIFFQHNIFVYLGLFIVVLANLVLFKTNIGLKIRAVGENPEAADSLGISVKRIRFGCVILGGMLVGLAGLYLTIAETHTYSDNMIAGRGWIAYIIVMFGQWTPYRILGASLLFGFVNALQIRLQIMLGLAIPYQLILMMPYILAIIVLVVSSRGTIASAPEALGRPYKRGEK